MIPPILLVPPGHRRYSAVTPAVFSQTAIRKRRASSFGGLRPGELIDFEAIVVSSSRPRHGRSRLHFGRPSDFRPDADPARVDVIVNLAATIAF
jgi:hypothetical protein